MTLPHLTVLSLCSIDSECMKSRHANYIAKLLEFYEDNPMAKLREQSRTRTMECYISLGHLDVFTQDFHHRFEGKPLRNVWFKQRGNTS